MTRHESRCATTDALRRRCACPSCVAWRRRGKARGEQAGNARLTATQVREILASAEPNRALADRYGVHHAAIWQIRAGRTWRHLQEPG